MELQILATLGILEYIVTLNLERLRIIELFELGKYIDIIRKIAFLLIFTHMLLYAWAIAILYEIWFNIQSNTYNQATQIIIFGVFNLIVEIIRRKKGI